MESETLTAFSTRHHHERDGKGRSEPWSEGKAGENIGDIGTAREHDAYQHRR